MWPLSDQSVARSADDDVFGELDSQVAGESRESFRRRDIRFAWGRITTGMIVDHPYGPHNVLIYMIYFA